MNICLYFSIGNGQPTVPALCQLYRHTFIPYAVRGNGSLSVRPSDCPVDSSRLSTISVADV